MKHIDEIYKEWSGVKHTVNSCHPVHDSAEACDFAEFYANQMLNEYSNWLWEMDRLKLTNQLPPFETPEAMTKYFLKARISPLHDCSDAQKNEFVIPDVISGAKCNRIKKWDDCPEEAKESKCRGCNAFF